jgi:hypothetical protein
MSARKELDLDECIMWSTGGYAVFGQNYQEVTPEMAEACALLDLHHHL